MAKLKAFIKGHKRELSPFFCALLLFVSILPVFIYNMSVPKQITAVVALALSSLYILVLLKTDIGAIGRGMKYFMFACVIITIVWQVIEQIRWISHGHSLVRWRYIFYYDKPFDVSVVLTVFVLIPTLLRLFRRGKSDTAQWRESYREFLNGAFTAGVIIYVFILVFGFVLNRPIGVDVEFNFVPFKTMISYVLSDKKYAYENTFLFVGNIAILLPLGFGFAIKKKKRRILIILLLPILASCLIEFSQYLLKNGHVDIDDVILNVLGFYLGVLMKMLVDLVRRIVTRGEEKTIFSL